MYTYVLIYRYDVCQCERERAREGLVIPTYPMMSHVLIPSVSVSLPPLPPPGLMWSSVDIMFVGGRVGSLDFSCCVVHAAFCFCSFFENRDLADSSKTREKGENVCVCVCMGILRPVVAPV